MGIIMRRAITTGDLSWGDFTYISFLLRGWGDNTGFPVLLVLFF